MFNFKIPIENINVLNCFTSMIRHHLKSKLLNLLKRGTVQSVVLKYLTSNKNILTNAFHHHLKT